MNPAAARETLRELAGTPDDWRRKQWELKAEMFAAHARIGGGEAWPAERLAAADRFFAAQEELQREVYGLGPQRHIFANRFLNLPWYKGWAVSRGASTRAAGVDPQQ